VRSAWVSVRALASTSSCAAASALVALSISMLLAAVALASAARACSSVGLAREHRLSLLLAHDHQPGPARLGRGDVGQSRHRATLAQQGDQGIGIKAGLLGEARESQRHLGLRLGDGIGIEIDHHAAQRAVDGGDQAGLAAEAGDVGVVLPRGHRRVAGHQPRLRQAHGQIGLADRGGAAIDERGIGIGARRRALQHRRLAEQAGHAPAQLAAPGRGPVGIGMQRPGLARQRGIVGQALGDHLCKNGIAGLFPPRGGIGARAFDRRQIGLGHARRGRGTAGAGQSQGKDGHLARKRRSVHAGHRLAISKITPCGNEETGRRSPFPAFRRMNRAFRHKSERIMTAACSPRRLR
jgi:hypothetical protein